MQDLVLFKPLKFSRTTAILRNIHFKMLDHGRYKLSENNSAIEMHSSLPCTVAIRNIEILNNTQFTNQD